MDLYQYFKNCQKIRNKATSRCAFAERGTEPPPDPLPTWSARWHREEHVIHATSDNNRIFLRSQHAPVRQSGREDQQDWSAERNGEIWSALLDAAVEGE